MDIFNLAALHSAQKEANEYRNKFYDLQAEVQTKISTAVLQMRLTEKIETQERLSNLYSELMSYKFKAKSK